MHQRWSRTIFVPLTTKYKGLHTMKELQQESWGVQKNNKQLRPNSKEQQAASELSLTHK